MPKGAVKESLWEKAKAQAKKQYPDLGKESPKFWKVVSSIYKKMGGTFSSETKKSMDALIAKCEQLEKDTPAMIMDKSLFMDIKKDIRGDDAVALLLQFANYMLEGGRFITKSQPSVDVSSLIPNYEITKSNIISTFTHESSTPIINMLKAMVSHPHKYLERAKTPSGKWRYIYRKDDAMKPSGEKEGLPVPKPAPVEKREISDNEKKDGKKEVASESFNRQKSEDLGKIIERMKTMTPTDRASYLSKMPNDLKLKIKARLQKSETEDLEKAEKSKEIEMGKKVEAEHDATMKQVAKDAKDGKLKPLEHYRVKIAKDHLEEFEDYYTRLAKMEKEGKEEKPAEKSQGANPEMDAWVNQRLEGVITQIMNNNPSLEKSHAGKVAREMLSNMHKRGLR